MDRLDFDDIEVTYRQDGRGERVVLVHASPFVSWYGPLVERLPDFSTLRYRRRLQRSEDGRYRPLTVAEDAAICTRLMDHVGWPAAHLVGHSYGALVALQAAMASPRSVATVALLEPAARGVSSSPQVAAALEPVIAAYRSGDTDGALDGFLRHVCGDDYRTVLDAVIPGAVDEARAEADLFFQDPENLLRLRQNGHDDLLLGAVGVRLAVGPCAARCHRPERVIDRESGEVGRVEVDDVAALREGST